MQDKTPAARKAHTELRRQDGQRPGPRTDRAAEPGTEPPALKPRSADDRLPGADEDDLFNDMPV